MIILTGGAGFIGSNVLEALNKAGAKDILVVDNIAKTEKWKNLIGKHFLDYQNKKTFLENVKNDHLPAKIDSIIHLGACSSTTETDAEYVLQNNYEYSKELASLAMRKQCRFIYASSAATYGDGSLGFLDDENSFEDLKPLNVYAYSKYLFDIWCKKQNIFDKVVGLKFFNVYGPGEFHKGDMKSVIYKGFEQIKETKKLKLFKSDKKGINHGEQKRDFIYVKDCASVISELTQAPAINGIYNLGTGDARTFLDLGKAIFSALDMKENIEFIEMPSHLKGKYQYYTQADMTKLSEESNALSFTSLEGGVKDYVTNYLQK